MIQYQKHVWAHLRGDIEGFIIPPCQMKMGESYRKNLSIPNLFLVFVQKHFKGLPA